RPRTSNANEVSVSAGIIGTFGTRSFLPTTLTDYRLQFADGLTLQMNRHTFKVGGDFSHVNARQIFGLSQFGTFTTRGWGPATISRILSRSGGGAGSRLDDPAVSYNRQIGNLTLETALQQLAFFALDSWRISDRVTLNYGVRWEGQFNPAPE